MTNSTIQIALVNNTNSSNSYAYITGLDINQNNAPLFIESDGSTVYHPTSPSATLQPPAVNCAISLGAPGSTRTITIPQIAGGRIWFVRDGTLTFYINPGPAIVEPSSTNPSDPNYKLFWSFCEFTFNTAQLYVNISYVDFVSLPISLSLLNTSGVVQSVTGIPSNGLDTICSNLVAQDNRDGAGWSRLIIKSPSGANLRALSPNSGIVLNSALFSGYFQPYVNQVWQKYASSTLTVNTQASWGDVTGQVSGGVLNFGGAGSFAQPTAADIFSCSTGPFGGYPAATAAEMGAIGARLAAAFNRSTLLVDSQQPNGEQAAAYYQNAVTNHYARIVHAASADGRGYAFPYDDVAPASGADQSGSVFDGSPALLTVTLGGLTASSSPAAAAGVSAEQQQKVLEQPRHEPGASSSSSSPVSALKRLASTLKKRFAKAK